MCIRDRNLVVNGKNLFFPLVSEESSVVAALANAAGFWAVRSGFHAEVLGTEKKGQVQFKWNGNPEKLKLIFPEIRVKLLAESAFLTAKMEERGGGICSIELKEKPRVLGGYFQLDAAFETCDAMGANFTTSGLSNSAKAFRSISGRANMFRTMSAIAKSLWRFCLITPLKVGLVPGWNVPVSYTHLTL